MSSTPLPEEHHHPEEHHRPEEPHRPEAAPPASAAAPPPPPPREIRIYSHSALFYWWPVWAAGIIMGLITYFGSQRMVQVPKNTEGVRAASIKGTIGKTEKSYDNREVLVLPEGKHLPPIDSLDEPPEAPYIHMSRSKNPGVLFVILLLIIIVISNVPLHGLWSVVVIMTIVVTSLVCAQMEWWDRIFTIFGRLQIYINAAGYFSIALALLLIWCVTVFIFDRRSYVAITSGQVRVCLAIGAGETVYDTTGMTFSKRQDDLFRHWIIGMGSGDLIIHRTNASQEIDMPNVLFIGTKIRSIERLLKEREVV